MYDPDSRELARVKKEAKIAISVVKQDLDEVNEKDESSTEDEKI